MLPRIVNNFENWFNSFKKPKAETNPGYTVPTGWTMNADNSVLSPRGITYQNPQYDTAGKLTGFAQAAKNGQLVDMAQLSPPNLNPVTSSVTPQFNPELSAKVQTMPDVRLNQSQTARQQAIRAGWNFWKDPLDNEIKHVSIEPQIKEQFNPFVKALSGGVGMSRSPEIFRAQQESEMQAQAIREDELFRNNPNAVIRFANTPTIIGLTPAQIVGIGAGAADIGILIKDFTAFSRLPQYKAMQQFAKSNNIPKDSPEFQQAKGVLQTAFNLQKQGMSEAADELMGRFNAAYSKATAVKPASSSVTPQNLPSGIRPVPQGTQTGAMAFGGKAGPLDESLGKQIATNLGIRFEGIGPNGYTLTDIQPGPSYGASFTASNLPEAQAKLNEMRAKFAAQNVPADEEWDQLGQQAKTPDNMPETLPKLSPEEHGKLYWEAQSQIERIKYQLSDDPVARFRFNLGKRKVGLDSLISIKEQSFPEYLTVKQAKALNPEKSFEAYTQKGTKNYNKVPKDAVLDQLTKEFGLSPDEIAERASTIRQLKAQMRSLEGEISSFEGPPQERPRTQVQKVRDFYKKKLADVKDVNADKVASLKDWAKYSLEEQNRVKSILTDYIQQKLPLEERGKFLDSVKNIQTQEQLDEIMNRVDVSQEAADKRRFKGLIYKTLSNINPKVKNGVTMGKFGAGIQQTLDAIKANVDLPREKAAEMIAANIEKYNTGKMSEEDMQAANELLSLAGINEQSASELENTWLTIKQLKLTGRTFRQEQLKKLKQERLWRNSSIIEELSGGKGVSGNWLTPEEVKKTGNVERFFNRNYSFDSLMQKLAKQSNTEPHNSNLEQLTKFTFDARESENAGIRDAFNTVRQKAAEIFHAKSNKDLTDAYAKMEAKVDLGNFTIFDPDTGGSLRKIVFTKGQLMQIYMWLKDPTLKSTFDEGMHWPQELQDAAVKALSPQEKELADFYMEFYQQYWPSINKIYERKFGIDLPRNPKYSPAFRDYAPDTPEEIQVFQDAVAFASTLNGSLKKRVRNLRPLKIVDANRVFINHIAQMEHFKAWTDPVAELRSVFGDAKVKLAIRQHHGEDILNQVNILLDRFALGGVRRAEMVDWLDKTRVNFSRAILGLKLSIALQQPTSALGYLTEMSGPEFVRGMASFWVNPVGRFKWLMENSDYIRSRYEQGFERDIKAAKHQNVIKYALTGKGPFVDYVYALIEMGDKLAVLPGFWAKYQAGLKAGLSEKDALREAGLASDRTQNTGAIDTLSTWQGGNSWFRAATMFQNQPNKYFQIAANNLRNWRYHRGSPQKALSSLFVIIILAPAVFEWIKDGFRFDAKKQLMAYNPLNNLLIVGNMLRYLGDLINGETFDYQPTPLTSLVSDTGDILSKGLSMAKKLNDPEKHATTDDVWGIVEAVGKAAGEWTGVPTPWMIQQERAVRNAINPPKQPAQAEALGDEKPSFDWRSLIFSAYTLGGPSKLDTAKKLLPKAIGQLGKQDKYALENALKGITNPDRIAEIKARDYTYDVQSMIRDVRYLTQGLSEKERQSLKSPLVDYYWSFETQRDEYSTDVPDAQKHGYLKDNLDFMLSQYLTGKWANLQPDYNDPQFRLVDARTLQNLTDLAGKYDITLDLIPAFQLNDKGQERIPLDPELWEVFYAYNALPGSSFLSMSKEQVAAGLLPEKYQAEWELYHKLQSDTAKRAFTKGHPEISFGGWRDDFRRENPDFDQWLQDNKDMKPLEVKKPRLISASPRQPSTRINLGGGRGPSLGSPRGTRQNNKLLSLPRMPGNPRGPRL